VSVKIVFTVSRIAGMCLGRGQDIEDAAFLDGHAVMFVNGRCGFDRGDPATMNEGIDVVHAVIFRRDAARYSPWLQDKKIPATRLPGGGYGVTSCGWISSSAI
jgi:hypothetical protein